ncbi:MAG: TetR family transcriptional regulator [Alphaproteobacteria bacterium]|nr:TetR family transcriptional regulator [Alphaproteobacteria bacterium]
MARTTTRKTASPATAAPDEAACLEAFLACVEEGGLDRAGLPQVAARAGVPLAGLYRLFPTRRALLEGLLRRSDLAMLEEADAAGLDLETSPRDRLFDLVLARLGTLAPRREAIRVLWHDARRHPLAFASLAPAMLASLRLMVEAAGFSADGLAGARRVTALGRVYARVLPVWLDDDPADLARTMAELDRRLRDGPFA